MMNTWRDLGQSHRLRTPEGYELTVVDHTGRSSVRIPYIWLWDVRNPRGQLIAGTMYGTPGNPQSRDEAKALCEQTYHAVTGNHAIQQ